MPKAFQHRVLFWGILGALVMRVIFIGVGAVLLQRYHWIIYPFGALLIWTGVKLLIQRSTEVHPENNLNLITTTPGVVYKITKHDDTVMDLQNPANMPEFSGS